MRRNTRWIRASAAQFIKSTTHIQMNQLDNADSIELMPSQGGAIEAIQRAEIDQQISTAKRYPRQLSQVKRSMLSFATLDEDTASSCFYTLPRGNKTIQGPSVRLAEIAVATYGNIRVNTRVVAVDSSSKTPHVVVQAAAHDLENNTAIMIEKRRRITKKRSKSQIDEDDINLAANAGSAIAFRDAVYKVIPGALIKPVYEQSKQVAIGNAKTLNDRRAKMVEAFGKMGVPPTRICLSLNKKNVEDIGLEDLETLIGLHTAIKDGQTSIDSAFPEPEPEQKEAKPAGKNKTGKKKLVSVLSDTQKGEDSPVKNDQPAVDVPLSKQQELRLKTEQAGHTLEQLSVLLFEIGHLDEPVDSWDAIPENVATLSLRAWASLKSKLGNL